MTFPQLETAIKKGNFSPVYLLEGEESYFIDALTNLLQQKVLSEEEKSFNQTILYGKETDAATVIGEARRYPMMADRVLVVLKEAQHLKQLDDLLRYVENPQESTVLVIAHKQKKMDRRKKLYKAISKKHVAFESKRIYDNQVGDWISNYLKRMGYQVTPKATELLAQSLGTDLGRIVNELKKLELLVDKGETIDDNLVEENVGISKDFNNFELQRALRDRDFAKAMMIQKHFAADPKNNPLVFTLGLLYRFFSTAMIVQQSKDKSPQALASLTKTSPYFIQDYVKAAKQYDMPHIARIMGYMRECDLKSKGVGSGSGVSDGELLKEMLYKIFYA